MELKPCPFDSSVSLNVETEYIQFMGWRCCVVCLYCGTRGPLMTTDQEAIETWNRRTDG
jgi:Lar family restriction alleviation protein